MAEQDIGLENFRLFCLSIQVCFGIIIDPPVGKFDETLPVGMFDKILLHRCNTLSNSPLSGSINDNCSALDKSLRQFDDFMANRH